MDDVVLRPRPPNVVFCPHPLMPARDRRMIFEPPRTGEQLDAYLARVIGDLPDPCVVTIGDCSVPRAWWGRVRVKPGAVIGVAAAVAGGDGGSDVGRIVLTIAVVVAAVYTGGLAAGAMGWAGTGAMTLGQTAAYVAASAAVMTVGMMAVNALLPLPTNDLSGLGGGETSPTYSLAGGSNRVRRYEPLPLVIGTHRMFPDQACAGYTLYVNGNDQYLFIAYNFGFGDLEITDLRIGDTPLTDYKDVTVQWATGMMPTLIAGNVDTQGGTVLTSTDGPIVRTTSVDTMEIHIDVQYVMFHAGNGGLEQYSASVMFEWRAVGSPTWLPFSSADGSVAWFGTTESSPFLPFGSTDGIVWLYSGTRDVWRFTLRKTVTKGQYEVRVTKLTADISDARTTCEISIPAIRSLQPDSGDYAGQRILGLKIRASGQLNGAVSQLSGLVSHRLNGAPTSNPATWFKAFALGAFIGGRRIWGAGLAASRIDLAALDAWAAWCDAKGLSCNMVLDQALSADTVLDRIARCGRGSKTWAPGALSAVWDADGLPAVAMFSPVNIKKGSFRISYPSEEMADELEVSYINPDNNWQRDTVRVSPNATNVRRTASVELLGCTSTALAGKEANLMYAQNLYRFRSISWEADAEGLTVRKGDVVALSHDLTKWGEAGRLVAVGSATQLSLDRTITLKPAGCWMAVCRPSGEISYHRVQVGATEAQADEVTLLDPLPTTPAADGSPAVDWRYLADAKATPGWRVKITDVSPRPGMEGVRITAQDDPAEYYAAESGTFAHVATPVVNNLPVLSGLQVSEELIRAGAGYAVQLNVTWAAQGEIAATRLRYKIDGGPWQESGLATGTQHSILVPQTGSAYIEVTGYNGLGQSNLRSRLASTYDIQGQDVPPPAVTGFGVSALADGTRAFVWTVATVPPDVTYLEIRYAASSGTAWGAMTPLGRVPFGSGRAESNVPAAGTWTFEARMLDASGNYSASGARATVTLGAAPFAVTNTNQLTDGAGFGAAAAAAQAAANSANAKHDELASDYKLSPLEKQAAWKEYGEVSNTYWGIDGKAAAFGIGWQRTAHGDRFNELSAYLSPLLGNLSTTSDIDGPTWRAYWSNYYAARQTLLNEIYAVAGTTALWSGVAGSGKPIDNAGRIIDLGDGGGAGQRYASDAPGWYPVGTLQQFKWSVSVGLGFGEWGVLRTERAWGDDAAAVVQTWKSSAGEWKRTGFVASGWGGWTRRVDRPITSGNASDFVGAGAINTAELNGTAASERVVLFDAAGVSHANYG
ncbi:host specificity factor TipJ family phage tail protein [Zoogloea sp.]|uniref:host specificity factor TipJ family phage tail protein n=1 Tax=Zoogloea sp. TaxID=49181 RepID=UPI00261964EF|nr:host specificity factor TipJ family phage tail protein [Zoogloea sp.]